MLNNQQMLSNEAASLISEIKSSVAQLSGDDRKMAENAIQMFSNQNYHSSSDTNYQDTVYQDRYQDTNNDDHYADAPSYRDAAR